MKNKIWTLLLVFILTYGDVFPQESKYREIYPYIETRNFIEAVPRLREYLKSDPEHPSANLQLALIFEERSKSYHPLLQYNPAVKNADNAKQYFLKANFLVDEKEINKNGKRYYTNFARLDERGKLDVSYADVRAKTDSAYIQIDKFLRNIPEIYHDFTGAVSHYDAASRNFAEITGQFSSLKDLFLLYDSNLEKKLDVLKVDYDSCIFYLGQYLQASGLYPVLKYRQTYEVRNIENFRLDGLQTQTDFLASRISLWDYGSWVSMVREMHTGDIQSLKNQLDMNEEKITVNLKSLSDPESALNAGTTVKQIDRDLILKLRNFDHNSVMVPLLQYQQAKQEMLFRSLHEYELMKDTLREETSDNLLTYYSQLFSMSFTCDSLIKLVGEANSEFSRQKHEEFMKKFFPGRTGLDDFIKKESGQMREKLTGYAHSIRDIILKNMVYYNDTLATATLRKTVIPLYVKAVDAESMISDKFYTTQLVNTPDSSLLAACITKPKKEKGNIQASLSRILPSGALSWIKNLSETRPDTAIYRDIIGTLAVVPEGYAVVINRLNFNLKTSTNIFILISESGESLASFPVSSSGFPRKIQYSESDGSYVIVTKGNGPVENILDDEVMEWVKVTRDGNALWKNSLNYSGNVRDLINTKSGYIIFGDYTRVRDTAGKVNSLNGSAGESAVYAALIDDKGNSTAIKCFSDSAPWQAIKIRKINDDNINVLGKRGLFNPDIPQYDPSYTGLVQFIVNSDLKVLFGER